MSVACNQESMIYGIVQYDFRAERPDELDVRIGDTIIILAQSNPEWLVVKPICRLGGPGLVPVSFIQLRKVHNGEVVSDAIGAIHQACIPTVTKWKELASNQNHIVLDGPERNHGYCGVEEHIEARPMKSTQPKCSQLGISPTDVQDNDNSALHHRFPSEHVQIRQLSAPVAASVTSRISNDDEDYYVVLAQLEDQRSWNLKRSYDDFRDFHFALLARFDSNTQDRQHLKMLPHILSSTRHMKDTSSVCHPRTLDDYVKRVLGLPSHMAQSQLVRLFFAQREGDMEQIKI